MLKRVLLPAILGSLVLLPGCAGETEFPNPLLDKVPADTPYLFASGEPMPEALTERFRKAFQPLLDDLDRQMAQAFAQMQQQHPERARRLRAMMTEFLQLTTEDGMQRAGLSLDDRFVFYGNGLLPVARMTVTDPDAFRGFLRRMLQATGIQGVAGRYEGVAYTRLRAGPALILYGLHEGVFSITATLPDGQEAMLGHLFARGGPEPSVADAGIIGAILEKYDFEPSTTGYLDTVRIAQLVLGGEDSPGLLASLGRQPTGLTPACRKETYKILGRVPRLVIGTDALSEDRFATRGIVELAPDLAQELKTWTAPVPGLGTETDALLFFGYSLNGVAAANSARDWLLALGQEDFVCAGVAEQPWAQMAAKVNAAPLYMVGNPKGLAMRLGALEIKSLQPLDISMQASLVMLLENPRMLPAMVQSFVPQLASLNIPADGTPVAVPAELTQGRQIPLFVAMSERLLGLSVGEGAAERLRAAMSAETAEQPPILQFDADAAWLYSTMAKWLPRIAELEEQPDPEAQERLAFQVKMWRTYSEIYERISYRIGFTEHGIEFDMEVSLQ